MVGEEAWFFYHDCEYQIDYGLPRQICMYITKYSNHQKIFENSIPYSSIIELLDKFTIDGKTIKEIWSKVIY